MDALLVCHLSRCGFRYRDSSDGCLVLCSLQLCTGVPKDFRPGLTANLVREQGRAGEGRGGGDERGGWG